MGSRDWATSSGQEAVPDEEVTRQEWRQAVGRRAAVTRTGTEVLVPAAAGTRLCRCPSPTRRDAGVWFSAEMKNKIQVLVLSIYYINPGLD